MPRKTLQEMVNLTEQNNQYSQIIPDELMIAIFWEETTFQNIEQIRGAQGQVGLGFGQVQEDSLPLAGSGTSGGSRRYCAHPSIGPAWKQVKLVARTVLSFSIV